MKNTIGLMAIFRNEADILKEFIEHHIRQGIDHFYLIDNASEDDFRSIIKQYDNITIFEEPYVANLGAFHEMGPQVKAYNKFCQFVKTDWLYVCDMDEFVYGPFGETLKSYIEKNEKQFDQLLISLKTFTSNNLENQPESVIAGFTERVEYESYCLTKSCIRTNKIHALDITAHILTNGITTNPKQSIHSKKLCYNFQKEYFEKLKQFRDRKDDLIYDDTLLINHYTVMSKNRYFNLKPSRGNAAWEPNKKTLQEFYLEKWNSIHKKNACNDYELKQITEKMFD